MTVDYIDIHSVIMQARSDGRDVDHVVITESTKEKFLDNMETATTESEIEYERDDAIGKVKGFDVEVGNTNKVVTKRGYIYDIDE